MFACSLCCECGTPIEPNPVNLCVGCIRSKVDITEGIAKQSELYMCRFCDRYLQPPNTWLHANLESKELLTICLKKLKDLKKVNNHFFYEKILRQLKFSLFLSLKNLRSVWSTQGLFGLSRIQNV